MTASWQVSAVVALDGRTAPHPRALALHLGELVYAGADDGLLSVAARLTAPSADEAVRELGRRLRPLGLSDPGRRRGVQVRRLGRLHRRRRGEPLVIPSSGGEDGSAGVREPRRPGPPVAPPAAVSPAP